MQDALVRVPDALKIVPEHLLEEYVVARIKQFSKPFARELVPNISEHQLDNALSRAVYALEVQRSDNTPQLALRFRHTCRFLGCSSKECSLCVNNPNKRCADSNNFDSCYADNQVLKAKCDAEVSVEVLNHITGQPYQVPGVEIQLSVIDGEAYNDNAPLHKRVIRELLRSDEDVPLLGAFQQHREDAEGHIILALQNGAARLPDVYVKDKNDTFHAHGSTFASFRLLAQAVRRDVEGNPAVITTIQPAVSGKFGVKTQRALNDYRKSEYPHYRDELTKLRFIGTITAQRLKDVKAFLGQGVPFSAVESVEELKKLMEYADTNRQCENKLLEMLNMKGKHRHKWEYLREVLDGRVVYDDNYFRVWWADAGQTAGLLYACKQAQVQLDRPSGLVQRTQHSDGAVRTQVFNITDAAQHEQARRLRGQAAAAWVAAGHPGWHMFTEPFEAVAGPGQHSLVLPQQAVSLAFGPLSPNSTMSAAVSPGSSMHHSEELSQQQQQQQQQQPQQQPQSPHMYWSLPPAGGSGTSGGGNSGSGSGSGALPGPLYPHASGGGDNSSGDFVATAAGAAAAAGPQSPVTGLRDAVSNQMSFGPFFKQEEHKDRAGAASSSMATYLEQLSNLAPLPPPRLAHTVTSGITRNYGAGWGLPYRAVSEPTPVVQMLQHMAQQQQQQQQHQGQHQQHQLQLDLGASGERRMSDPGTAATPQAGGSTSTQKRSRSSAGARRNGAATAVVVQQASAPPDLGGGAADGANGNAADSAGGFVTGGNGGPSRTMYYHQESLGRHAPRYRTDAHAAGPSTAPSNELNDEPQDDEMWLIHNPLAHDAAGGLDLPSLPLATQRALPMESRLGSFVSGGSNTPTHGRPAYSLGADEGDGDAAEEDHGVFGRAAAEAFPLPAGADGNGMLEESFSMMLTLDGRNDMSWRNSLMLMESDSFKKLLPAISSPRSAAAMGGGTAFEQLLRDVAAAREAGQLLQPQQQ